MNILQVVPELNLGGVETGTVDLAVSLAKMGHKSYVASCGGELISELKKAGVMHYKIDLQKKSLFTIFRNVGELVKIIKKERIDIVHARSRVPAWAAFFAARFTDTPFITTCHGYYSSHFFSVIMGWGKFVIVPSSIIGRHEMDDFGVPFGRIRLIPRSVNLNRFKFISPKEKNKREFVIGIIGRITPIKGHIYFLWAMSKVARVIPNLSIWIVGDVGRGKERYKDEIDVLVKRLGLSSSVEFLGAQRDIPHILTQLNLLVVPTVVEEAFGRVIIEANAAGVPVVASRVGGIVDIIEDNVNGLLFPPKDVQAMSSAIIKVLRDENLAERLANNALRTVAEKFTLDKMISSTLKVYEEALEPNILIIKFSAIGDVILATPSLRALREKYPKARITCLTSKDAEEVLSRCPYIDELLVADFKFKDSGIRPLFKLANSLRKKSFDLCLDLQNNKRSHLLAFLSMARHRYGYNNKKLSFLLNHKIALPKEVLLPVEHQAKILELLGISSYSRHLELWTSEDDDKYIDDFLNNEWIAGDQQLIGINISSSNKWLTKRWPVKFIVKLSEMLMNSDMRLILTGTENDLGLAEEIFRQSRAKPIIACGKTSFNQLVSLIKRCQAYISGDSAPLHIAAGVNTPIVALFGPTDPKKHMPPAKKYIVIRKDPGCAPCYKAKCPDIKCMAQITPEEVFGAVKKVIQ
ncbi:MAG: lipopolysaccharide heptosyltransferase II [Candidatus Omnitrophica bacterium CG11_big_fil_rev_8_21_14_0_20_42_13]|uniref:lipopolysaccharide heptosyltransferase II n=1 Tax=Candidatus Ghiorseimicrobium undicola TaxID=1974746 RepID=A0A2H0LZH4_9BACT|nr:MAG: lipopolysaccharide heptosyltransferase II [Candidatus Omnitrophica bacterium CG11_big_fil_rev_8_21_14_0_20_42_13]